MSHAGQFLVRRPVLVTRSRVLWLAAWLLVAGSLLSFAWWHNQQFIVALPASSWERQQFAWGPGDWIWYALTLGLLGAVGLGALHALAGKVQERRTGHLAQAEGKLTSRAARTELGRFGNALAALGFLMGAYYWTRFTALLLVIVAAGTITVGFFRRGASPRSEHQQAP
jgi:hypothetical protein